MTYQNCLEQPVTDGHAGRLRVFADSNKAARTSFQNHPWELVPVLSCSGSPGEESLGCRLGMITLRRAVSKGTPQRWHQFIFRPTAHTQCPQPLPALRVTNLVHLSHVDRGKTVSHGGQFVFLLIIAQMKHLYMFMDCFIFFWEFLLPICCLFYWVIFFLFIFFIYLFFTYRVRIQILCILQMM